MTPADFLATIIAPAAPLLPSAMDSPKARCLLLAIAAQESGLLRREPHHRDGERSYWRLGKNYAVLWTVHAARTCNALFDVCMQLDVIPPGLDQIYGALDTNDALAYCVARLLLIAAVPDTPLPAIGEREAAWAVYERVWCPPSRNVDPSAVDRWAGHYDAAAGCFDTPTPP